MDEGRFGDRDRGCDIRGRRRFRVRRSPGLAHRRRPDRHDAAAYDAAQDLQDFPEASCPRATFDGPRLWRFEEPYTDTDGSGDFNYPGGSPEPFCDYNGNGRWDGIYLSGGIDHLAKFLHDPSMPAPSPSRREGGPSSWSP